MSIETANALRAARARIEDPEMWCKGAFRRGDAYCAAEVVWNNRAAHDALSRATDAVSYGTVSWFNDAPTTTHADIMALFDRAILAEEETERTCGSGAHPRHCKTHPDRYQKHCDELSAEYAEQDETV